MQKFISKKPCRFGERNFVIGEEIPAELIDPARVPALLKYGTIVTVDVPEPQNDEPPAVPPMNDTATPTADQTSDKNAQGNGDEQNGKSENKQPDADKKTNGKKNQK